MAGCPLTYLTSDSPEHECVYWPLTCTRTTAMRFLFARMGNFCTKLPEARNEGALQFIRNHVAKNCVVLFSKSFCPYCKKIKILFQEQDINYKAIELDLRKDGTTIQNVLEELTGVRTVPRVFVNGKCIGGATDTFSLHSKGKLMPLVLKCSPPYILDESYSQLH
ncbi:glutaredoxin 2 isoform X2 [Narcine bancroftii]|uniref:glutaredoxin 2 isoform X2 n=1 Tax=Narcine bancroftii TaxID=1343680 RepID=UPI00383218C7